MSNLPKFILSFDRDKQCEYIIHTQEPPFIAQVFPENGHVQPVNMIAKKYPIGTRTNRINGTYYLIPVIKLFYMPKDPNQLPKLMSRMGNWYYSVIKERNQK